MKLDSYQRGAVAMGAAIEAEKEGRKQAAYVLPLSLIDRVKDVAHARRCWPAEVVEDVLRKHLPDADLRPVASSR